MQAYFASAVGASGQHGPSSSQNYDPQTHQYTTTAYGYYPIDQGLIVGENHVVPSNGDGGQIRASHVDSANTNGHDAQTTSPISTSNTRNVLGVDVESPTAKQRSQDDTADAEIHGEHKRKRSKVSRACDQCRKKKIRCDADASEDGIPKTCGNCQTRGQLCEFSRVPQKRGPSKGYIKELSERVQQVEGQLALQGSAGFRSSMDGSGALADPTFSPEDDELHRRQSSLSHGRNPFANISRDRIPSVGGWHINDPRSHVDRNRFSIAIPPDQAIPMTSPLKSRPPFWHEWMGSPTKRRKLSSEADGHQVDTPQPILSDHETLSSYWKVVHKKCPILLDSFEANNDLVKESRPELQNLFLTAVNSIASVHSNKSGRIPRPLSSRVGALGPTIQRHAQEHGVVRSSIDYLVLLWCTLLHVVTLDQEVVLSPNTSIPDKAAAIVHAINFCINAHRIKSAKSENSQFDRAWARAISVTVMFARLHALETGLEDEPFPTILLRELSTALEHKDVPSYLTFRARSTETFQAALSSINNSQLSQSSLTRLARLQNSTIYAWSVMSRLDIDHRLVQEVEQFVDLLSLGAASPYANDPLLESVLPLVDRLCPSSVANPEKTDDYLYDPLAFHFFTVAVFTLLELVSSGSHNETMADITKVKQALEKVQRHLKKLLAQNYDTGGSSSNCEAEFDESMFWAGALLKLMDVQLQSTSDETVVARRSSDAVVSVVALLQRGYRNVLEAFTIRNFDVHQPLRTGENKQ